jgi:hypothetical protein
MLYPSTGQNRARLPASSRRPPWLDLRYMLHMRSPPPKPARAQFLAGAGSSPTQAARVHGARRCRCCSGHGFTEPGDADAAQGSWAQRSPTRPGTYACSLPYNARPAGLSGVNDHASLSPVTEAVEADESADDKSVVGVQLPA